jgi:6-phosphogluconolactonase
MIPVGHEATRGRIPRNFEIHPSGRHLIAANQDTDDLVVFGLDPVTGRLTDTGQRATAGTPICVRVL